MGATFTRERVMTRKAGLKGKKTEGQQRQDAKSAPPAERVTEVWAGRLAQMRAWGPIEVQAFPEVHQQYVQLLTEVSRPFMHVWDNQRAEVEKGLGQGASEQSGK
jgi:hypothetical protein